MWASHPVLRDKRSWQYCRSRWGNFELVLQLCKVGRHTAAIPTRSTSMSHSYSLIDDLRRPPTNERFGPCWKRLLACGKDRMKLSKSLTAAASGHRRISASSHLLPHLLCKRHASADLPFQATYQIPLPSSRQAKRDRRLWISEFNNKIGAILLCEVC